MFGNSVTFDHVRREKGAELDYSPLPRMTGRSISMGILVSMGGLIFGYAPPVPQHHHINFSLLKTSLSYDTGQIAGFVNMPDFLQRFGENDSGTYKFSNVRSGVIVGLLSIGTLFGALIAAPIADRIGRRLSVSFWCLITAIGFVVQIAASSVWQQIAVGRLVSGFGVGALSLLVPMYQAETAPPWIRGSLVCTYQLFITFGIFLAAAFNLGTYNHLKYSSASWRIVLGLGWIWTIGLGLGILLFSETPRFDYRRGRVEEARKTLMRVYGAPANHWAIHSQMEEIESKLRAESTVKSGLIAGSMEMFNAPRMRYRIALGVALQAFQQLTGANYFFYYGTTIFTSVQISSFITQVILNSINFSVTFIGLYLVEHYGRRKSLIVGSIWMFICFLIFASVGQFKLDVNNPQNTPGAGIILIVFAAIFVLGYATTWGPMVWTLIAEIYPSKYRARAMALATASNWTWNFLIAFFTPFITTDIHFAYGYVFAFTNIIGGLIVWLFVIEGQGRTLEEIDTMYVERVSPMKSAKWVAPPPEEMARVRREAGTADDAAAYPNSDTTGNSTHGSEHGEHVKPGNLHTEMV
ncbi:general substrate transporter [Xylariaceae sp. FL0255]|nr:general substrate transporter [Xylariaceae sp. FL0255]